MPYEGTVLIVPIAHDLDYADSGKIICGRGTRKACDHALVLASGIPYAEIFVSATHAPRFDNEVMGKVMQDYLWGINPKARIAFRKAPYFNTLGEVLAVMFYVSELQWQFGSMAVGKIIFAVKDWHAERVRVLAREVFDYFDLTVPFCIKQHEAPGGFIEKRLEPWKTKRQIKFFRQKYVTSR